MRANILETANKEILNEIARWKVIECRSLFSSLGASVLYDSFRKHIKRLEDRGLLSVYMGKKNKRYLTLSSLGSSLIGSPARDYKEDASFNHDIICSTVLRELMNYDKVVSATAEYYEDSDFIDPDGVLLFRKGTDYVQIGVEVELTQKSKSRVLKKFQKYSDSPKIGNVFYITNSETIYKRYRVLLKEMNDVVRKRIAIVLDSKLDHSGFDYKNAKCWFDGDEKALSEVIG